MNFNEYNREALRTNIDTLVIDISALKDLLYFKGTVEESNQIIIDKDRMKGFDYILNITVERIEDEIKDIETIIYDLLRGQKQETNQAIKEGIQ